MSRIWKLKSLAMLCAMWDEGKKISYVHNVEIEGAWGIGRYHEGLSPCIYLK